MKQIKKCFIESVICLFDGGEPFLRVLCQISHSCLCVLSRFSCVRHFVTLWTIACQAPLSIGFSRQEYWSGLPLPSAEDLPDPGIKPTSLESPALTGRFFTTRHLGNPFLHQHVDLFQMASESEILRWPQISIYRHKRH